MRWWPTKERDADLDRELQSDLELEEEEQREREPVCQSCRGTGQWLTFPCPDCSEDADAERD